jgi:hypothetical protein
VPSPILSFAPECFGNAPLNGVLHHLGVDIGEKLPENEHNPRGTWRRELWYNAITHAQSSRYVLNPKGLFDSTLQRTLMTDVRRLYATEGLWGVAMPDLCLLGAGLFSLMPDARVVVTMRDFEQSVQSYMKMSGWPRPVVEYHQTIFWLGQAEMLDYAALHGIPMLIVPKDILVSQPERAVPAIAEFVYRGQDLTPTEAQIDAAVKWINPEYHHVY